MQHVLRYLEILLFKCKNLNFVKRPVYFHLSERINITFFYNLCVDMKKQINADEADKPKGFLKIAIKVSLYDSFLP